MIFVCWGGGELQLYQVQGRLVETIKSYMNSESCVRARGDESDPSSVQVGLNKGCIMSV